MQIAIARGNGEMFIEKYPKFQRNTILKAEMLESLKEYPRDMLRLMYQLHADGIISGCYVTVEGKRNLVIAPGIIKHNGILYYLKEKKVLANEPLGIEQILVVRFLEKKDGLDDILYPTEIKLKTEKEIQEDEIELCRFILKEGAELRKVYQDFRDMATVHNTINIIEVPYAGIGETTLSPEITYRFAMEMFQYHLSNPYDTAFVMQCMQQNVIQRELIEAYIQNRIDNVAKGRLEQRQLYRYLNTILDMVKRGDNSSGRMRTGPRRMLVD